MAATAAATNNNEHASIYALPELCIAVKVGGIDVDQREELVAFRDQFFPDDRQKSQISALCKLVFRLRYWCAFNRATKVYKDDQGKVDKGKLAELEQDLDGFIDVTAADMQHGTNQFVV